MPISSPHRLVVLAAIAVAAACGGGSSSNNGGTGLQATPATMVANASQVTAGCYSSLVPDTPVVVIKDATGNPVSGVSVTFAITSGGGSLTTTTRTTNAQGKAGVGWTLGATGTQVLTVSSGALTPVTFAATGTGTGPYCVELIYTATPDPALRAAADSAAARWSRIITSNLSTEVVTQLSFTCASITGLNLTNQSIRGILIFMQLAPITSSTPGLVTLGSSGPCFVRSTNGLTVVGGMRLNSDYLLNNLSAQQRTDVVLHEMGHSLGFGTLWTGIPSIPALPVLLSGSTTVSRSGNPIFTGNAAIAQYVALGAAGATSVPVENCGGTGTMNGHWREDAGAGAGFGTELMTGYITSSPTAKNPLSKLTIASMKDMGYATDSTQADAYTLNNAACPSPLLFAPPAGSVVVNGQVVGEELAAPTHIVRGGRTEPIIRK
ncbi:MAG: hypothetical protein HY275_03610 [Gemmatimonadetes bacterium]|nr:hypothetical protein [Gemmatimonadota bacterium]